MKLQFKEQDFQIKAVKAVVDCFQGQPLKTNRFTLERSKELIQKVSYKNIKFFAKRNKDMRMIVKKFQKDFNYKLPNLDNEILKIISEYKN